MRSAPKRAVAAGASLFREGDRPDGFYLLTEGLIGLTAVAADGRETVVALIESGEIVGAAEVLDGSPRRTTAVAIDAAEVVFVSRDQFHDNLAQSSDLLWSVALTLASRTSRAHATIAEMVFLDAQARLARRLLALAVSHGRPGPDGSTEIGIRLSQEDLARLVGAGRESINKAVRALRTLGAITFNGGRVAIRDRQALAEAAALDS